MCPASWPCCPASWPCCGCAGMRMGARGAARPPGRAVAARAGHRELPEHRDGRQERRVASRRGNGARCHVCMRRVACTYCTHARMHACVHALHACTHAHAHAQVHAYRLAAARGRRPRARACRHLVPPLPCTFCAQGFGNFSHRMAASVGAFLLHAERLHLVCQVRAFARVR